jgi:MFS family permease
MFTRPTRLAEEISLLREREFRLLFYAQTISVVGDNFTAVALVFAVLDLTGSAADLGIALAARTLPLVAFVLAGGVWADRLPRKQLMIWSNFVRFAIQALLAGLLVTRAAHLWQLVGLLALHGTATAFFKPAATGLLPETVPYDRLQQANALLSLSVSTGGIVGPALAGVLVAAAGPGLAIGLDALSFLTSALLLLGLRPVGAVQPTKRQPFIRELGDGWAEVRSRTWLWASLLHFAVFQFTVLGAFQVLGPLVADRSLGGAPTWGLLLTAAGLGSVVGGVLALRFRPQRLLLACFAMSAGVAPSLVLLALAAPTWTIICVQVLWGVSLALASPLWETALQQNVPLGALSRVDSYDWMVSSGLRPLGLAVAGPIAAVVGLRGALLGATAILIISTSVLLCMPSIRNLGLRSLKEDLPGTLPNY